MMNYIEMSGIGEPDVLKLKRGCIPKPCSGEVLIKVHAAGINRADIGQRSGHYPTPQSLPQILGLEVAGEIVALADDVKNFRQGDLVCALTNGGGYAEFVTTPATQCLPVPKGLTLIEAASLPEVAMRIWSNLFDQPSLTQGQWFLLHGGTSGIGTFAIQLARAKGINTITTVGSDDKCRIAIELGARYAINYHKEDFLPKVLELTDQRGVDVIFDMVGGDYTAKNIQLLAMDGRLVQLATLKGNQVNIDLLAIMQRRAIITGALLKMRSNSDKSRIAQGVIRDIWPLVTNRSILPIIEKVYAFKDVVQAHQDMEQGGHIGKLILVP